jgi:hypothetical protein
LPQLEMLPSRVADATALSWPCAVVAAGNCRLTEGALIAEAIAYLRAVPGWRKRQNFSAAGSNGAKRWPRRRVQVHRRADGHGPLASTPGGNRFSAQSTNSMSLVKAFRRCSRG